MPSCRSRPDERVDLIANFRIGEGAVVGDDVQDVERVAGRMGSAVRHFFVDDLVDSSTICTNSGSRGERKRVRQLLDAGRFDECLGPLEELAELIDAAREVFAEEGVERDAENEFSPDGVEVDRSINRLIAEPSDDTVDRCVAAVDDHWNPTVEARARERSMHSTAATPMVGAVGSDHRSLADDEADPDDVELVAPTEVLAFIEKISWANAGSPMTTTRTPGTPKRQIGP